MYTHQMKETEMGGALTSGCNNYPWKIRTMAQACRFLFYFILRDKWMAFIWNANPFCLIFCIILFVPYTFCSTIYMYLIFFSYFKFWLFYKESQKKIFVLVYMYSTPCPLRALFFPRRTAFLIWITDGILFYCLNIFSWKRKQKTSLSNRRGVNGEPTHESPTGGNTIAFGIGLKCQFFFFFLFNLFLLVFNLFLSLFIGFITIFFWVLFN